jgi:hypothetical protein
MIKPYRMRRITLKQSDRQYLLLAVVVSIVQIILFKIAYPFPDFISDSYNYIESAALHLDVNLWPIGYAKFLWFIHKINYSGTFLVCVQYFLLQAALAYLFFFIRSLFRPSVFATRLLFIFLLVNPLSLYISNAVLSDAIFTALSIVWLVELTRQLVQPNVQNVFVMAIVVGIAFTLRYTAIYYPIISGLALLLSKNKVWVKVAGAVAPLLFMIPFVLFTQAETKKVTGTAEFSVFGGWQLANNALYMYNHIQVNSGDLPAGSQGLDSMVRQYYKVMPAWYFNFDDFPGTFFIKHAHAPLKQYMLRHYAKELDSNSFLGWGKVSPMYNAYGTYLIGHYPLAFARYYLWMNTKNYFDPFLEKFNVYNLGEDSVWQPAQYWFHLKTPAVWSISKNFPGKLFYPYPPLFLMLNAYFAGCMLWLLFTGKIRRLQPNFQRSLYFFSGFLLVNFAFSIFATPVVLRYQLIPLMYLFVFSILLLEFTDQKEFKEAILKKEGNAAAKKKTEAALVTFALILPIGFFGGIFCLLLFLAALIANIVSFFFLLFCGLSSLIYGYISRNFSGLIHHEPS